MSGSWLIVKWFAFAIFLVCVTLSLVVSIRLWPKVHGKTERILSLTVLTVLFPNLIRDFSDSMTALRVGYVVSGAAAIGLIVVALRRLFGSRGLLRAGG